VRYLVDANVLSEPTKPGPNPAVIRWLRQRQRDLSDFANAGVRLLDPFSA
jgi:hypothetical protein